MLTISKVSPCYSYSACWNRKHPSNFQNKSISSPFKWVSRHVLLLSKMKGRGRSFFGRCKKGFHIVRLPQEHLVIIRNEKSLFARLEIILHVLCFLLDPFAKNHCRTWSSTGAWQGYLKCSIWGTNNQLPNIFYKFVHLQLF